MSGLNSKLHVGCLAANLVLGKDAKAFQLEIERLISKSGELWLSDRLKTIYNAALHLRNNDYAKAISLYQSNSIAYHKSTGLPKGPFKRIVSIFINSNKKETLQAWSAILRFYTGMVLETAPRKTLEKAYNAIAEPELPQDSHLHLEIVGEVKRFLKLKPGPKRGTEWKNSRYRYYYGEALNSTSSYYSPCKLPRGKSKNHKDKVEPRLYEKLIHSYLTTHYFPESLINNIWFLGPTARKTLYQAITPDEIVGKIHPILEGGNKVRLVAIPNGWLQSVFVPLDDILSQINSALPESCVKDQKMGLKVPLKALSEGKEIFSVDLEKATDRLPLSLQVKILNEFGLNEYSEALLDLTKRKWSFPLNGDKSTVQYNCGQPMGLYGSFGLLNLTNIMIARLACRKAGVNQSSFEDVFAILGDDVIFNHRQAAENYISIMGKLGVNISQSKTFFGTVGQFAGFNIFKTKHSVEVFRPYKFPDTREITNPISFLDSFGAKRKKFSLNSSLYWKTVFNIFQRTKWYRSVDLSPFFKEPQATPAKTFPDQTYFMSVYSRLLLMQQTDVYDENVYIISRLTYIKNEANEPFLHERRMDAYLGHDHNYITNREREVHRNRKDLAIYADPLMREIMDEIALQNSIDVKSHNRLKVDLQGNIVSFSVKKHRRKKRKIKR